MFKHIRTSATKPPVYFLIRINCSRNWVQYVSLLLWIKLTLFQNASSGYPRKSFLFHLKFCYGEVWMSCMFLWIFYTTSSPAGINLSCFSEPSSCHTPRNPWICHAQIKTPVTAFCVKSAWVSRNCWISLKGFGNKLGKGGKENLPSLITPLLSLSCDYLSARIPMHFAQDTHHAETWAYCLSCPQVWKEEGASFLSLSEKVNTKSTVCQSSMFRWLWWEEELGIIILDMDDQVIPVLCAHQWVGTVSW